MKFWGVTMLLFIGAGVAAAVVTQIVLRILFSIAVAVRERGADEKEIERAVEAADVEDEMDRLIELKSLRVGFCVCGAGFLAALAALALGCPAAVMLNILFLSFHVGALAQGAVSLRYYRRGV